LIKTHPAFESLLEITSNGYAMIESEAIMKSGLTDEQWYGMPRQNRARRIVWLILSKASPAIKMYEETEAKKNNN